MTDDRGRVDRQSSERSERRRRSDDTIDAGVALKMRIPPEIEAKLKAEGRSARWINDVGSRVHDLTVRDDWDKVEGVEPRTVKLDKSGNETTKAILVSKRIDFINEDRAEKEAKRLQQEDAMLRGQVSSPEGQSTTLAPGQYADKANKIERDNRILD